MLAMFFRESLILIMMVLQPRGIADDRHLDEAEMEAQLCVPDFAACMASLLNPREVDKLRTLAEVIRVHMEPQVASRTPRIPVVPRDCPMDHYPELQMEAEAELMFAYALLALTERGTSPSVDFWDESERMHEQALAKLEEYPTQGERMLRMMMRRATIFYLQGAMLWLKQGSPEEPHSLTHSRMDAAIEEYQRALELILFMDRAFAPSLELPRAQGSPEERAAVALAWLAEKGLLTNVSVCDIASSVIMGTHHALRQDIHFGLARCQALSGNFSALHQAFGSLKASQEADDPFMKSQVIADALEQFESDASSVPEGRPFIPTSPSTLLKGVDQMDQHLSGRPSLIQRPDESMPSSGLSEVPLPVTGNRLRKFLGKALSIGRTGRAD